MDFQIDRARKIDIPDLLGLYHSAYGDSYPLKLGTDSEYMKQALSNTRDYFWPVIKAMPEEKVVASVIFELDRDEAIGKVTGVVVSKEVRKYGLAKELIRFGMKEVFKKYDIRSLYATARTISLSSQRMLLSSGFKALGIFPNARKIKTYETLALLVAYKDESILDERAEPKKLPINLAEIYAEASNNLRRNLYKAKYTSCDEYFNKEEVSIQDDDFSTVDEFEYVFAPKFTVRRFNEYLESGNITREKSYFPFYKPNMIVASSNGMEIFANFSKKDHYCVLIGANKPIQDMGPAFKRMIFSIKDLGVYYIELIVQADHIKELCFLIENKFLPSAIYPAMIKVDGKYRDFIVLARTMVPLDFSDTSVDHAFKGYIDQYVKVWAHANLESFKVDR
jgi:RimJ/RimL family protein N-acetyltransferase